MTILKTLIQKGRDYLFKEELARISSIEAEIKGELQTQKLCSDIRKDKINHLNESIKDPVFVLKHAIKAYGPFPDPFGEYNDIIEYIEGIKDDSIDKNTFFNEISDVAKNNSFKLLLGFLMKEQLIFIGTKPETDMQANYARATLNSFQILSTEIDSIHTYNKQRNEPEEQFDEHGVINGED